MFSLDRLSFYIFVKHIIGNIVWFNVFMICVVDPEPFEKQLIILFRLTFVLNQIVAS